MTDKTSEKIAQEIQGSVLKMPNKLGQNQLKFPVKPKQE